MIDNTRARVGLCFSIIFILGLQLQTKDEMIDKHIVVCLFREILCLSIIFILGFKDEYD